jgi:hypothetical protein
MLAIYANVVFGRWKNGVVCSGHSEKFLVPLSPIQLIFLFAAADERDEKTSRAPNK